MGCTSARPAAPSSGATKSPIISNTNGNSNSRTPPPISSNSPKPISVLQTNSQSPLAISTTTPKPVESSSTIAPVRQTPTPTGQNNNSNVLPHQVISKTSNSSSTSSKYQIKAHKAVFTKGFAQTDTNKQFAKHEKSLDELESILRSLNNCYVFASATEEQKEELAQYMFPVYVSEGDIVVEQGDTESENFYAIQQGTFDFFVDGQTVARRSGSAKSLDAFFGELALLYNSPRQATAICTSIFNEKSATTPTTPINASSSNSNGSHPADKALLWAIGRDTFRQVLAKSNQQSREEKRLAVQSIPLLKESLTDEQLNRVIEAVNLFHFRQGQRIVRKGDPGDSCYFIKQGRVLCTKIGEDGLGQVELGPGSYFGERALLKDEPRAADVIAVTEVIAMALDRKSFDELLGPLRSVMDDHMKERVVEALPILKELNPQLRREIIADFELETFRKSDIIVQAGELKCDKFYVIRSGEVQVLSSHPEQDEIAVLKEGSWFGEMALLEDVPRVATCMAHSAKVECFVLRRATFEQLSSQSKILTQTNEFRKQYHQQRRMSDASLNMNRTSSILAAAAGLSSSSGLLTMQLNELDKMRILGKGTFGTVHLVRHQPEPHHPDAGAGSSPSSKAKFYALKQMNKHNLVRCEQQKNVMNEKLILQQAQFLHPFVLKLYQTFQDRDSLYMVLEFVQGGELFSIMQQKFRFPLYPTMFYAACIIDLFDALHAQSIIYRDLKPENVLIDKFGYVKLADFGFAKKLQGNNSGGKTYTLCGTPEYLAPEVVLGVGHDKGVDYWGIGILIYEMLVGMSPFADEYDEDQQVVCTNIVKGRVPYDKLARAIAETEGKMDPFWQIPGQQISKQMGDRNASSGSPSPSAMARKSLRKLTGVGGGSLKSQSSNLVEDLIRKLLNKSPLQRLGNLKDGAKDVKQHLFFKTDIDDWEELRQRKLPAPLVPTLKSDEDTTRFDQFEPDPIWPQYKGEQEWCDGF